MAVFPDRIVLKNSTDAEADIISAISPGAADEITQGEIVLGLTPGDAKLYTRTSNGTIVFLGGTGVGATTLSGLSDVNTLSPLPSDGNALTWDAATSTWISADPFADVDLGDLGSVDLSGSLSDGDILYYNAASSTWVPAPFAISQDTSPELGADLETNGHAIKANGSLDLDPTNGNVIIEGGAFQDGSLTLNCTQNTHGVTIKAPPHSAAASYTLVLPETSGLPGQALITTDGTGTLEWLTAVGSGTVTSVDATGSNGVAVTSGPITTNGTLGISLTATGVVAGSYVAPAFTVNSYGRITSAQNGAITLGDLGDVDVTSNPPAIGQALAWDGFDWSPSTVAGTGTVTSITAQGAQGVSVVGGTITTDGTFTVYLNNTSVIPGTYEYATLTVDQQGRLTAASSGDVPLIDPLAVNGDMMFRFAGNTTRLQVGSEGQALVVEAGYPTWKTLGTGGTVTSIDIANGTGILASGGPITDSGSITVGLANSGVTPGVYTNPQLTIDATGRVTNALDGVAGESASVIVAATAPTTRPGGAALREGDLWWETDTEILHVYYNNSWEVAGGSGGASNLDGLSDVDTSTTPPATGQVLVWNGANWVPGNQASGGGGSGAGIYLTETQTASGGTADFIGLGYSGILQRVGSTLDAWIVLYSSAAERAADASRAYNTDPTPGSGVLFEAYVTAGGTVVATPGTTYLNNDTTLTEAVYAAVRDQSGAAVNAAVTFSAYGLAAITAVSGGTFGSGV